MRRMRRMHSEQIIIANIALPLFATDTLSDALPDVETQPSSMTGTSVAVDLEAAHHATAAAQDPETALKTAREPGADLLDQGEDGFRIRLLYGFCPVGALTVAAVQFADRIGEYRDMLMRLAPGFVLASVAR
jgi:hypothetical protein